MKLGTIEGGGTKFVVGVGDENGNIFERESFPTTTPEETMKKTIEFFKDKGVEAIGFGSFGPIDPDKTSPTYGSVTTTPKPGWSNHNVVNDLEEAKYNINSIVLDRNTINKKSPAVVKKFESTDN